MHNRKIQGSLQIIIKTARAFEPDFAVDNCNFYWWTADCIVTAIPDGILICESCGLAFCTCKDGTG